MAGFVQARYFILHVNVILRAQRVNCSVADNLGVNVVNDFDVE